MHIARRDGQVEERGHLGSQFLHDVKVSHVGCTVQWRGTSCTGCCIHGGTCTNRPLWRLLQPSQALMWDQHPSPCLSNKSTAAPCPPLAA